MALIRRLVPALLAASWAAPAAAWHEPSRPVTDYSAATLKGGEWRIYLTTLVEYGIVDGLEIGTMPLVDLARVPNLTAKWNFLSGERFGLALQASVFTTNPSYFSDILPDVQIYVVPVGLFATWRSEDGDIGLHGALHYVTAGTTGAISLGEALDIDAAVQGSTLRLAPVLEWRRTRSFAWVVEGSILLSQSAEGQGSSTYVYDEGRTTVDVYAGAAVSDDKVLGNVSLSAYWSWESFNLRLGMGYGHLEVPLVGLLFDRVVIQPEINLYWRF